MYTYACEVCIPRTNLRLQLYTRPDTRYNILGMGNSKDLKLTWGDRDIVITMSRSFPLHLFGKMNIPRLQASTLPQNQNIVRVGFYLGLVGCI